MLQFYKSIWHITWRRQVLNILLSLLIAGLAAFPLNYQKLIVNGLTYETVDALALRSLGFAMAGIVVFSLSLKWALGFLSSTLGEEVIRTLRKHILSKSHGISEATRKSNFGVKATMVSAEAEQVGKFMGSAISEPIVQAGTLVVVVGYIAANQPALGLIAFSIILPQVIIVLFVQKRVNSLVSKRVRTLRQATALLAEDNNQVLQISSNFDEIYQIRSKIFSWKQSSKFLLSTINGLGTVAVLVLGGWQVLNGETDVGTVVAATVGLTRLQGPIKQLVSFYRQISATAVQSDLLSEAGVSINNLQIERRISR